MKSLYSGYAGSVPSECPAEWPDPQSQSKSSTDEQHQSRESPPGSPHLQNMKTNTSHSNQSEYFPTAETRTTSPPPLAVSPTAAQRATPPPHNLAHRTGTRSGTRSVSKGGGVQMVLGETGSWSELANHTATMPADATNGADGSHRGAKSHGMLGFLSRRTGRERSPKPKESGVLGKEGARVVINAGK